MPGPLVTALGRLGRGRGLALLVGLGWLFVLATLVALLWPRPKSFLVEARTERIEVRDLGLQPDGGWNVTGFCLAEEAPLLADAPEAPCLAVGDGSVLRPADGTRVEVARLGGGAMTVRVAPARETGAAQSLATLTAPGGDERTLAGAALRLVHPARGIAEPPVEFDFAGRTTLGAIPEDRATGIVLEGRVGGSVAGWLGAGRFDVIESSLARGDVVTLVAGRGWRGASTDDCSGMSRGFLRLPPADEEGLLVAYASCADALRIDRVGAWFELSPSWAARLLHDPLPLALAALAGLLASVAAVAQLFRARDQ